MASIGYATVQIIPSLDGLDAEMKKQMAPLATTSESEGKKSGGVFGNGFMTTVSHIMIAAGLYQIGQTIATGIGNGIVTGLKTASFMQQAQQSLTTLLGGASGAAKSMLTDLTNFAAHTPFELQGVITGTQQLLGAGAAADSVIPSLTALGDANAAIGGSQDSLNKSLLAWTQLMTRGKLDTQDLYQLSNAGIPIWKELAKALDVPTTSIQDMVSSGTLLSSDTLPKLQAQLEKDYGGAMALQAKTLAGAWSNVHDTITQALGQAFTPLASWLAVRLPGWANIAANAIQGIANALTGFVNWVKANAAVLERLGVTVAGIAGAWLTWKGVIGITNGVIGAFNILVKTSPFGWLLTILGLVAGAWLSTGDNADRARGFLAGLAGPLSDISTAITPMVNTLLPPFKQAWHDMQPDLDQIATSLGGLVKDVLGKLPGLIKAVTPVVADLAKKAGIAAPPLVKLATALVNLASPAVESLATQAVAGTSFWGYVFSGNFAGAIDTAQKALKPYTKTMTDFVEAIGRPVTWLTNFVQSAWLGDWTGVWIQAYSILVWFGNSLIAFFGGLIQFCKPEIDALSGVIRSIETPVVWIINFLQTVFLGDWNDAWIQVNSVVTNVSNGVKGTIGALVGWFTSVGKSVYNALMSGFANASVWLLSVASDLFAGFKRQWDHITSGLSSILTAPFSAAVNAVKILLGIHSPSRVMGEIAGHVADGFINGLNGRSGDIADAYGVFGAQSVYGPTPAIPDGGLAGAAGGAGAGALAQVHVDAASVLDLIQQVADGRIQLYARNGARALSAGSIR